MLQAKSALSYNLNNKVLAFVQQEHCINSRLQFIYLVWCFGPLMADTKSIIRRYLQVLNLSIKVVKIMLLFKVVVRKLQTYILQEFLFTLIQQWSGNFSNYFQNLIIQYYIYLTNIRNPLTNLVIPLMKVSTKFVISLNKI